MNQLASPPQITPVRRRHSEPPTLWLWVLAGSLLIHLATIVVLRVWLARSMPVRAMPAPIELVAIEAVPSVNPPSISSPAPVAPAASATTQPAATPSDEPIAAATASPAATASEHLVATPAASSAPPNVAPSPSPAPSPAPEASPTASPTSTPSAPPAPTPWPSPSPTPSPPPTPVPSASATPATSNEWLPAVPEAITPDPIAQTMDSELPAPPPLLGTGKGISMKVLAIRDGNQGSDRLDAIPPDQLPSEVTDPDLEYQPEFRSEAARQTVTLQVLVDQTGKLQEIVDIKHSPGAECSEYAKKLVHRISFPPPRQNRLAPQGYFEVDLKLEPI